ncbi:hypothetical protein [Enterobacter sp.]|uniref:hypothetical protein n=1 Tax=Enterobacter sp. TaxID=42895 RepID=UPI00296FA3F7|nr:hypothetical protein [Enterobacter sp.]
MISLVKHPLLALLLLTGAAQASYESNAEDAKVEMGKAFYKMGVLTQSFTEKGKLQGEALGYEFANKFTFKMDDFIGSGVNAGASCADIAQKLDEQLITPFSEHMRAESGNVSPKVSPTVADKFVTKFRKASLKYTTNRCEYLNE